ncbi:MAG: endonuclease/exonuclease/phosphatase family protein [Clostridia bacterium]|nr:endonuclease/exonuclease/phosphatase family protein [Clostridia bacterium]
MKYVTFNIRYDCGHDGINNFEYRKDFIVQVIRERQPDIIGFQEVLPHVAAWLKESLQGYSIVGCGRGEHLDGEQVCIAYRTSRMNLMDFRTIWLSPTPYLPGSRYPDQSDCPRTASIALFHDLQENRVFRVINTHLDHVGQKSRLLALQQILSVLRETAFFPDAPVILAGDFNCVPESDEMQYLKEHPEFVNLTEGIGNTYHGFMHDLPEPIDYIFLRGDLTCRSIEKWQHVHSGVYLSDHYPIEAELV